MNENLEIIQNPWEMSIKKGLYPTLNNFFSAIDRIEMAKVPWIKIVVFDGFDKLMRKIKTIQDEIEKERAIFVQSPLSRAIVIPPSGFFTEEDILRLNKTLISSIASHSDTSFMRHSQAESREAAYNTMVNFFIKEKKLTKNAAVLFTEYLTHSHVDQVWSDQKLYRMFAIVGFIKQNNYKTLGEFVEQNKESLLKKTLYSDFSELAEYSEFTLKMIKDTSIISWRKRSFKKSEEMIYSLNKEELISILNRKPEFIPQASYSSSLKEAIEIAKNKSTMTKNEIFKTLSEAAVNISQKEEYWEKDLFYEANTAGQKAVFAANEYVQKGIHPDFLTIVKFIKKHQDELSIMDFIVILKWFPKSNYVIRSADFNKSMTIFKLANEKLDNPVGFVKFLTRLFISHEGVIPSYTEWKRYINVIDKEEDFCLPMSLMMPLIVSNENPTISMKNYMQIIESVRANYESIILPSDKE